MKNKLDAFTQLLLSNDFAEATLDEFIKEAVDKIARLADNMGAYKKHGVI